MFKAIGTILAFPDLRQRIFFTLIALAIYRIGFFIYLPGVDVNLISLMTESQNDSSGLLSFISMTSLLTGGALSQATIFSLGIMPYIGASIIFSPMTKVFPKLEELQKEGESGRKVIAPLDPLLCSGPLPDPVDVRRLLGLQSCQWWRPSPLCRWIWYRSSSGTRPDCWNPFPDVAR